MYICKKKKNTNLNLKSLKSFDRKYFEVVVTSRSLVTFIVNLYLGVLEVNKCIGNVLKAKCWVHRVFKSNVTNHRYLTLTFKELYWRWCNQAVSIALRWKPLKSAISYNVPSKAWRAHFNIIHFSVILSMEFHVPLAQDQITSPYSREPLPF